MEFLRSLLRRRFARAQVATSENVGCFLRLTDLLWQAPLEASVSSFICNRMVETRTVIINCGFVFRVTEIRDNRGCMLPPLVYTARKFGFDHL